ncbi:aldehyde dehydrogenase family protein [Porticoccaceae bacterium]|nr:aldehyde dehydrogenase family protein [Porticoccaceae bacterium]MDB2593783.1 aldehyde dehydrogenase family protein [Porticoccaceae bacterium]
MAVAKDKYNLDSFYINGQWQEAKTSGNTIDLVNPANANIIGRLALGNAEDVDSAVMAAKAALRTFQVTSKAQRLEYLEKILAVYKSRYDDFAEAIRLEMGAPITLSREVQAYTGVEHLESTIAALKEFYLTQIKTGYSLHHEPVGVCGLITPWNWPISQLVAKVAPAIAAGCTMVVKPSEFSPLSAQLFADVIDQAALPPGVFNLVNGEGPTVGAAISQHPEIDMVSFTGSTRAGIAVAQAAATNVKRVCQELGGKSPMILTEGIDLESVVPECVWLCMENTGQSCNAGTRLLVPESLHDQVVEIAKKAAESYVVGDPANEATQLGPLANRGQFEKVTSILQEAETAGLQPITGGLGPVADCTEGYFIKPTIFANLNKDQFIAKEEVFGPVLAVLPYKTQEQAIEIANATQYGLSAYIYAKDNASAEPIAQQIRCGMVHINGAPLVAEAPFGGYKQSGNGREWGLLGLHEFLEVKAVMKAS